MKISRWSRRMRSIAASTSSSRTRRLCSRICGRWQDLFGAKLRRPALRFDQHVFRVRPAGRRQRQASLRLQPRQASGLRAGRHRADRDAGRLSARLRGSARNTSDKTTLSGFLHKIEAQYGKARAHLGDGSRHPDRGGARRMRQSDPPVAIWWVPRRDGSASWRSLSSACRGMRCGRASR